MIKLYFITGNKNKLKEVQTILPEVQSLDIDLPEIQELDAKKIIEEKLKEARKAHSEELFCEDTSLYIECLNGLPGPLIKWFLQALGTAGIYTLIKHNPNKKVVAKTIVGYTDGKIIKFFEGDTFGTIAEPTAKGGFGWDALFKPDGGSKSFAEMNMEEKNKFSMRRKALEKLKEFLEK